MRIAHRKICSLDIGNLLLDFISVTLLAVKYELFQSSVLNQKLSGGPEGLLPQGSHRTGRARLAHPAPLSFKVRRGDGSFI